jgi:hypothetical protein
VKVHRRQSSGKASASEVWRGGGSYKREEGQSPKPIIVYVSCKYLWHVQGIMGEESKSLSVGGSGIARRCGTHRCVRLLPWIPRFEFHVQTRQQWVRLAAGRAPVPADRLGTDQIMSIGNQCTRVRNADCQKIG